MYAMLLIVDTMTVINDNGHHVSRRHVRLENRLDLVSFLTVFSKPQVARHGAFEDGTASFKVESTPDECATATSPNSLTIDNEMKMPGNVNVCNKLEKASDTNEKSIETGMLSMTLNKSESETKEEHASDGDEDDEDMLTACINMGIQTSR